MKPKRTNKRDFKKRNGDDSMYDSPLKRQKKKKKYRHKNHWLEEDDDYEFSNFEIEEE